MIPYLLAIAVAGLLHDPPASGKALIQGLVVNGSRGGTPAAGAEVVLLAGKDGQYRHVAGTTTDSDGRFVFDRRHLTPAPDLIYIPGANWDRIHYPGLRMLVSEGTSAPVRLTVYDAVTSPCPLVADVHEIDLHVAPGVLEVTEILVLDNPTRATYVGATDPKEPKMVPTTLSLSIPEGVTKVTFNKEFDANNFRLEDGRLVTNVPWLPGKRQLAFKYQLPVENDELRFERALDLPCLRARLAVSGKRSRELICNLPEVSAPNAEPIAFESDGSRLPAGYPLELRMRQLAVSWVVNARWTAILVLGALLAATLLRVAWRKRSTGHNKPGDV